MADNLVDCMERARPSTWSLSANCTENRSSSATRQVPTGWDAKEIGAACVVSSRFELHSVPAHAAQRRLLNPQPLRTGPEAQKFEAQGLANPARPPPGLGRPERRSAWDPGSRMLT